MEDTSPVSGGLVDLVEIPATHDFTLSWVPRDMADCPCDECWDQFMRELARDIRDGVFVPSTDTLMPSVAETNPVSIPDVT